MSIALAAVAGSDFGGRPSSAHLPSAALGASHAGATKNNLLTLPVSARAPVSAALGVDDAAYRVRTVPGGFLALNRPQRLQARFTRAGVWLVSAALRERMSLRSVGYGSALESVADASPRAHANQVLYASAGLKQWYRNGPLGLEQGFTIPRAPSAHRRGPLTLALALSGNAQPSLSADGLRLILGHAGAPSLYYSNLLATDARGRALPSRLRLRSGRALLLTIDIHDARYPLRIDPLIQQGGKLVGEGGFGAHVALSADGNTALVGAPSDNSGAGAVWAFTRSGEGWSQQGSWSKQGSKLTGGAEEHSGGRYGSEGAAFGSSVAISADGNYAVIGAPYDTNIFEREGEVTEGSRIVKGLSSTSGIKAGFTTEVVGKKLGAGFGNWVKRVISNSEIELSELVQGGGGSTVKEKLTFKEYAAGAAWVFTRSAGFWTQQGAKLTGSGGSASEAIGGGGGGFGSSVALSGGGDTAIVGGEGTNEEVTTEGEVTENSPIVKGLSSTNGIVPGSTVTSATITYQTVAKVNSEHEVELSSAVGGAGSATVREELTFTTRELGAAWVFARNGEDWSQQGARLTAKTELSTGERFGASVALSADGNTALIGSTQDGGFYPGGTGLGAARVFTRSGETWSQQGPKLTGGGEQIGAARFGGAVALSADGNTALIGGLGDNSGMGAAWIFTRSAESWSQQGSKLTGGKEEVEHGNFGDSVALSEEGNTALIGGQHDNPAPPECTPSACRASRGVGAAWLFTRSGEGWTQEGPKLTGREEVKQADFGSSVTLSRDGTTALIGGPADNGGAGAAWVFAPPPPPPAISLGAPGEGSLTSQTIPTFTWSTSDEGGPGIARVEFLLDGSQVGGVLAANATSFTPRSPLPDGSHSWQVRATDNLGYATTSPARTITIDTVPPTTPLLQQPLAGGRVYQSLPMFSWVASNDATSGVGNYTLLLDGGVATTVSPGACPRGVCSVTSPRALSNGSHTWQVLAGDRAGNTTASATQTFVVAVGPTPPAGPVGISINQGDYATNTPRVVLDIVWPLGADQAFLSNDGGFNLAGQTALVPIAAEIPWTLRSAGSERLPRTVYLRFPESTDPTSTFTDDIILDTTRPVIESAKLLIPGKGKAPGEPQAPTYRVRLQASESISGISAAQFSANRYGGTSVMFRKSRKERGPLSISRVISLTGASGGAARAHQSASTIKARPPHRPRWVRVQSAAGTFSPWRRLS
jgi:hypothetical protein